MTVIPVIRPAQPQSVAQVKEPVQISRRAYFLEDGVEVEYRYLTKSETVDLTVGYDEHAQVVAYYFR